MAASPLRNTCAVSRRNRTDGHPDRRQTRWAWGAPVSHLHALTMPASWLRRGIKDCGYHSRRHNPHIRRDLGLFEKPTRLLRPSSRQRRGKEHLALHWAMLVPTSLRLHKGSTRKAPGARQRHGLKPDDAAGALLCPSATAVSMLVCGSPGPARRGRGKGHQHWPRFDQESGGSNEVERKCGAQAGYRSGWEPVQAAIT